MNHYISLIHIRWCAVGLACIALAPAVQADRAYVSNEDGHTVSVIDTARGEVIATIEVGKRPRGMKLNRDGSRLFVALSGLPKCPPTTPDEECAKLGRDLKADGVAVVDTAARKLIKVLEAGSDPEQFDLSADGKRLFVANEDVATTSVVEIETGKVIARIPVGVEPEGVVVSPNGKWALVTNESDNSISVIDTRTLKVVNTIQVGKRPRDLAFTPDSTMAYVSGEFDASLYRIAVPKGQPVERVLQMRQETRPMSVVLDTGRDRIYMSTGRGGTVAIIDVNGHKLVKEIKVGTRPWGIAMSQDGRWLYTANGPSNDVSVIDTSTLRTVKTIPAGRSPWGVVVGPTPPQDRIRTEGRILKPGKPGRHSPPARAARRDPRAGLWLQSALLTGRALRVAKELCQFPPLLGIAENAAGFSGQCGVLRVRRCFDEVVVAQDLRDRVDDARTLVQARELAAALPDAFIDVFDARFGRVVMPGRVAARRVGRRAQADQSGEGRASACMA
ncbi:MAG: cytochrome D1 domain-containing protein [Steroidobacter sp.]